MNKPSLLKLAFTLAEVLITLGIIGIVAEMTIPTLVQSTQQQVTITSLKKAYSTLSQAYSMAVQESGSPDTWGLTNNGTGAGVMMNMLKPYLRVTKDCGVGGSCFPNVSYKHLDRVGDWGTANGNSGFASLQLADGSILADYVESPTCTTNWGTSKPLQNICGYIYVDINGFKKPNQVGKDFFLFYVTKDQMIPVGTADETAYGFSNQCVAVGTSSGWGCAAWVIYNQNMDYLKCPTSLSWNGQSKCN